MQGRLESQIKAERNIKNILAELPKEATSFYLNFSTNREFRTCVLYLQILRRFLIFHSKQTGINIQNIDFSKISDDDISLFLKSIETKECEDSKEYTSFSYRQTTWSALNSFFKFLDKKRLIESNPVRLIERPSKKDKVKYINLKEKDLECIAKAAMSGAGNELAITKQKKWKDRDLAIVYTFIFTGMRESALCEINMDKINFAENKLVVIDKGRKTNEYHISEKLKGRLLAWIKTREILLDGKECDALFISNRRTRITPLAVTNIIAKYSEEALGYKVSPHKLRRGFCNMIYKETRDIEFTRSSMKHSNISTTRIYIEDNEQEINKKVANILSKKF